MDHRHIASGSSQADSLKQATREAAKLPAGTEGLIFLPYLAGELHPLNDGFARGVFFGLNAEMGRAHLFRAVLEAIAPCHPAQPFGSAHGWNCTADPDCRGRTHAQCSAMPDHRRCNRPEPASHERTCRRRFGDRNPRCARRSTSFARVDAGRARQAVRIISPAPNVTPYIRRSSPTYTALYPRLKDLYPCLHRDRRGSRGRPRMYTYSKQIPILASPDILVVGSGRPVQRLPSPQLVSRNEFPAYASHAGRAIRISGRNEHRRTRHLLRFLHSR